MSTEPRDAAAVILLRHDTDPQNPELFWVRRNEQLAFLGGYYAFAGGQLEDTDGEAPIENCSSQQNAAAISAAARELFEELGVLAARGAENLTKGQLVSLLDDLETQRTSWPELLRHYCLRLDANDFAYAGRWVTPPFSARRFDTLFFLVRCPAKQEPRVIRGELETGAWITAQEAYSKWQRSEILAVTPTLHALQTLAAGLTSDLAERLLAIPEAQGSPSRLIEFRPNYICFPVRTPTRPPATHTNCYLIYNSREFLVIDPGSPYLDEQQALAQVVDQLIAEGRSLREIVLTHLHPDHVGGVNALREHLRGNVAVAAHALTAEALRPTITVDHVVQDNDVIELPGIPRITLRALHTPGHARGHLCFHEEQTGTLISGDNIVGLGTVLIDPPEGNMQHYFESLERLRSLENLSVIFGAHGPAVGTPYKKIDEYISHRLERETNILAAVRQGATGPKEIVARVYSDVSPKLYELAERSVLAHIEKLEAEGLVQTDSAGRFSAT